MNLLLYFPKDLQSNRELTISGPRARHLREIIKVVSGQSIRVGEVGKGITTATVVEVSDERVRLVVDSQFEPEKPSNIHLVLAMPRPQSLKKVLQTCATLGVDRITLIKADRVEKSYFLSPLLSEQNLQEHLILGLEQGVATKLPQIEVLKDLRCNNSGESASFKLLLEEIKARKKLGIIAEPSAHDSLLDMFDQVSARFHGEIVILIGPEGGFREHEVSLYHTWGFVPVQLGTRILRVETAVCVILSQIDMLRQLERKGRNASEARE